PAEKNVPMVTWTPGRNGRPGHDAARGNGTRPACTRRGDPQGAPAGGRDGARASNHGFAPRAGTGLPGTGAPPYLVVSCRSLHAYGVEMMCGWRAAAVVS